MPASNPVTVAVTGAAGQIGYALLFRIASGQLLGDDAKVHLRLLEVPQAVKGSKAAAAMTKVRWRLIMFIVLPFVWFLVAVGW